MNKADPLSTQELNFLSETFRLLGDPSRLRILLHCEEGPKSVTDISETLELSQSLVSHHLRLLRGARLVTRVRHSKQMFYEISDQHVGDVLLDMLSHVREEREGVAERDASVQHSGSSGARKTMTELRRGKQSIGAALNEGFSTMRGAANCIDFFGGRLETLADEEGGALHRVKMTTTFTL